MLYKLNKYIIEFLTFAEYDYNKKQILIIQKKLEKLSNKKVKLFIKEAYLEKLVSSIHGQKDEEVRP